MAKKKMRKDGRFEVTATIDGKRYHFYGETQKSILFVGILPQKHP